MADVDTSREAVERVRRLLRHPDGAGSHEADEMVVPSGAISEIAAERQRQITNEGWTPEHDDTHDQGELACAAASYALLGAGRSVPHGMWPWRKDGEWPKPKSRRRDLIRAAALILAEIERLDRAMLAASEAPGHE